MNILDKIKFKFQFYIKKRKIDSLNGIKRFNTNNSILISGMPRGGSTWFAELLNNIPKSYIVWEPLHLEYYPRFKHIGFKWRQYIDESNSDKTIYRTFEELFNGSHLTPRILRNENLNELLNAETIIFKFCRANRLLPYLTSHFEFKSVIHLTRHPCAVVASQIKFGEWDNIGNKFNEDELKPDGFIENYYTIIKDIDSPIEKLAAIWCLDNIIPLNNKNSKWTTVYYENLLIDPKKELQKLNIELPKIIYEKINMPSSTTIKNSPINNKNIDSQLSYWKNTLTKEEINKVLTILNKFNITNYNESIYPIL